MMEGIDKKERENARDEIYSKAVRAGKRTYFFDVKATRRNEYYLTITESKKRFDKEGHYHFEKHKIFLYKEDFEKFAEGLDEVVQYIKTSAPEINMDIPADEDEEREPATSNVTFEDLDQ